MSRVTSQLQITIPKAIAERHRIRPGADLEWMSAGDSIRLVPEPAERGLEVADRLEHFDRASGRQAEREGERRRQRAAGRGWTREELYARGHPD